MLLIFNKNLSSGVFPVQYKDAFIYRILKSGNKNDIANYWPIAMFNVLSKINDKIVAQLLSSSLLDKLVLEQHGYLKGRSTQLISLFGIRGSLFKWLQSYLLGSRYAVRIRGG